MTSGVERLTWEGVVYTDADVVYVNGMLLANVLRASMPNNEGNCGTLTITVERRSNVVPISRREESA